MELDAERRLLSAELDATRTALETVAAERDRLLARLRALGVEP
jgi:hypothetical protein